MARTRIYVDVNLSTLRKLILWAASRDSTRTQWLKTVVVMRCEENAPKVRQWIETEAKNAGVAPEEIERAILARNGFDFDEYKRELLEGSEE